MMRRGIRRTAMAAVSVAAAVGIALAGGSAAFAQSTYSDGSMASVIQVTAKGEGVAVVQWFTSDGLLLQGSGDKTRPAYARASIQNESSGFSLDGWLERSTDGGKNFSRISGVHSTNDGSADSGWVDTDRYYDGPGYLARACFQFTSWAGAAKHCSPAI